MTAYPTGRFHHERPPTAAPLPKEAATTERHRDFNRLMLRYQDYALAVAYRFTDCEVTARDISQDSFVRAYQQLSSFRGEADFGTWLFTIVRTTALNHLAQVSRRQTNRDRFRSSLPRGEWASVHRDHVEDRIDSRVFYAAFDRLPAADAQLLRGCCLEDRSIADVAQETGTSRSSVRTRIHRAKKKLRRLVEEHYGQELNLLFPGTRPVPTVQA